MAKTDKNNASAGKGLGAKLAGMTDTNLLLTITIAVFFLLYIGAMVFLRSGFLKPQTFFNILNANAALIILACGMSLVMITGGIDISVGGVTALVSMCCAVYLDYKGGNVFMAVVIAILIGLAFGAFQGALVAYLDIQPFIVTLAGMFFARGMTTIVNTSPFNVENEAFVALKMTRVNVPGLGSVNKLGKYVPAYVEIGVLVALLVVIVMFVLLRWMKLGRNFYAVGGNKQSALMLGINVKRTKFLSHLICGLLAGIGGFVYFLHVGSGSPSHASGAEMDAIASSIIGGTMLTGGVGNVLGTFFGVLSLNTIQNIVSSVGFDEAWWTGITKAVMLCLFLVVQSVVMSVRKKRNAAN
ncbi:MAG: sugar ABC transporter permease YjfF [Lachnospiraceae bacterium]|jgi:ribose/xylose/arabinose/galactoside ABC-type transport system permease subunit|nr:sugar ABC transporter permease YjfF [Lachnospiraceae bacterium]MCI9396286.1 sugar ABC transporter permease YjfF [Lachnospiraceae bacterium]